MDASFDREQEINSLIRLIRRAVQAKRFALVFVNCASLTDQKIHMQGLEQRCSEIDVELTTVDLWERAPITNLHREIREHLSQKFADNRPVRLAIQVTGLEISILLDVDERFPAVLQTLNINRERYRDELPYPLIIWLPDYAYIKLANVAPDFWSVRDGSFSFLTDEDADFAGELDRMVNERQDLTEWRDKIAQIPLIERILDSPIPLPTEIKTDLELKLAEAYRFVGKLDQARDHFSVVLHLSRTEPRDPDRTGKALNGLGLVATDWGDLSAAIQYFEQYLDLRQGNLESIAVGCNHLGIARYKHGDLEQATEAYERALKINQQLGKRQAEGDVLGNLGIVYRELGEFDQALEFHRQALHISRETENAQSAVKDLGNMGLVYYARDDYKTAIDYYSQALQLSQQIGNRQDELNQHLNLGDAWRDFGEPEPALENFEAARRIAKEIGSTRLDLVALEKLIELAGPTGINDQDRATYWVEDFLKKSLDSENPDIQRRGLEKLIQLCRMADWPLPQKGSWWLQAERVARQLDPEDSVSYFENLAEIYRGLGQDEKAEAAKKEAIRLKQARQLAIWLEPGQVEVIEDRPVVMVRQNYLLHFQIGASASEYAWIYRRDLPEDASRSRQIDQMREGFKISSEAADAADDEASSSSGAVSTGLSTAAPKRGTSGAARLSLADAQVSSRVSIGNETGTIGTVSDAVSRKRGLDPVAIFELQGDILRLNPSELSVTLESDRPSNMVSVILLPETAGDHQLTINVTIPAQRVRDTFKIVFQVLAVETQGQAVEETVFTLEKVRAYFDRGNTSFEQGEYEQAIANYDKAIELNPEYAEAFYQRSLAREDQGDPEGAKADLEQAIALDPSYGETTSLA